MKPPLPLNAWLRLDAADRVLRRLPVRRVLEVGAGEGGIGARLAERYDYVAVEPDRLAYERASERLEGLGEVMLGDTSALNGHREFDVVCAFEVLEHIEDDLSILCQWRERVRPGGWILLSVPAHEQRFAAHDRMVGHFRRYDPYQLASLLVQAGFVCPEVHACSFPLGYALEAARNTIGRLAKPPSTMAEQTAESGRKLQPPAWLGPATRAFTLPFRVLQRPFAQTGWGTGLVAVARRP